MFVYMLFFINSFICLAINGFQKNRVKSNVCLQSSFLGLNKHLIRPCFGEVLAVNQPPFSRSERAAPLGPSISLELWRLHEVEWSSERTPGGACCPEWDAGKGWHQTMGDRKGTLAFICHTNRCFFGSWESTVPSEHVNKWFVTLFTPRKLSENLSISLKTWCMRADEVQKISW